MPRLVFFFLIIILLSSCATHIGTMSSGPLERNFTYIDYSTGTAQTVQILGIGGLGKDGLVNEARRLMMIKRPLNYGEQYINYTVDFKYSYFLFLIKTQAIVTADIISFSEKESKEVYSDEYLNKVGISDDLFIVGDFVIFEDNNLQGKVLSISGVNKLKIEFETNGPLKTKEVNLDKVYTNKKSFKGFVVSQTYSVQTFESGEEKTVTGEIVGLGKTTMLLKKSSGEIFKIKYPK